MRRDQRGFRIRDGPSDGRHVLRDVANDFALEVFDNFGAALLPPHLRGGGLLAVLQRESIGQVRKRIRFGLVVICMIGVFLVSAWTGTKRFDAELVHHVLMVFLGGPVHRGREVARVRGRYRCRFGRGLLLASGVRGWKNRKKRRAEKGRKDKKQLLR